MSSGVAIVEIGGATWSRSARIVKIASAPPAAPSSQVQLGPHVSAQRIARRDNPRRAAHHHRPLAGAAREDGTNRGRGAAADVVGLITSARDSGPTSSMIFTASSIAASRVAPSPNAPADESDPPVRLERAAHMSNAPVGSSKNITPKRENKMSNAPRAARRLLASATRRSDKHFALPCHILDPVCSY